MFLAVGNRNFFQRGKKTLSLKDINVFKTLSLGKGNANFYTKTSYTA